MQLSEYVEIVMLRTSTIAIQANTNVDFFLQNSQPLIRKRRY